MPSRSVLAPYSPSHFGLRVFAVMVTALLLAPSARAQIVADRPGFGDGSATLAAQQFQVEGGYGFATTGDFNSHDVGQLLLRYGLVDWLELRGGIGSYVVNEDPVTDGYSGTTLGAKARVLRGAQFTLGVVGSWRLSNGTGVYDQAAPWQNVALALDAPATGPITFSSNLGRTFSFDDTDVGQTMLTFTLGLEASRAADISFGYAGFYADGGNQNFLEGGITYLTRADTQLDVNWAYQLDDYSDRFSVGVGFARRF